LSGESSLIQPQGIFISYRREQTAAHAGRIYDRLCDAFGERAVFMDVDSIGLGLDFARILDEAVSSCNVMLALIGPGWAEIADQQGRRLDDPTDYVRQELQAALRREIPVVPVLVHGAALPRPEELPEVLRPLLRRQAFPMPDETFRSQAQVLVERLRPLLTHVTPATQREPEPSWTVELLSKSPKQRVFRVYLTHAKHLVTYSPGFLDFKLYVDDVLVGRKYRGTITKEKRLIYEFQFQLSDGDAERRSTFSAHYDPASSRSGLRIMRALLTIDGRLLYDEDRP
jgi:hypothetical protein